MSARPCSLWKPKRPTFPRLSQPLLTPGTLWLWQHHSNFCLHPHMAFSMSLSASSSLLIRTPAIGFKAYPKSRMTSSKDPQLMTAAKTLFLKKVTTWAILESWSGTGRTIFKPLQFSLHRIVFLTSFRRRLPFPDSVCARVQGLENVGPGEHR